jgi:hypothetical protein
MSTKKIAKLTTLIGGTTLLVMGLSFGGWYSFRYNRAWPGPYRPYPDIPFWPGLMFWSGILVIGVWFWWRKR